MFHFTKLCSVDAIKSLKCSLLKNKITLKNKPEKALQKKFFQIMHTEELQIIVILT